MINLKETDKYKTVCFLLGFLVLSIFQTVIIVQADTETGWIVSGRIHMDGRLDIAGIQVYSHGTNELVNSSTTDSNGSYSIKLQNGEYDIKVESYLLKGSYNVQYDTKTIIINNSNITLDFKASGSIATISTIFFMFALPVIFPRSR